MKLERVIAAAFVVLVSTAIVGLSAGSTGASFTGTTTNPNQSWATSTVAAPASTTATSAPAGAVTVSWPATTTPPNGHTVTYLVLRNGVQVGATASLTYSDTPGSDGTYSYAVQTKIAQGGGFFTSGSSPSQNAMSDRVAPTTPGAFKATSGTCCTAPYDMKFSWTVATDGGTGVASQTLHYVQGPAGLTCPTIANTANFPTTLVLGAAATTTTIVGAAQWNKICGYIEATDVAGNTSAPSAIKSAWAL